MPDPAVTPLLGPRPPRALEDALMWAGLMITLGPMLVRALSPASALPYWDLDPLTVPAAILGLGPGGSMLVDVLIVFGAAFLVLGTARLGCSRWVLVAALAVAAANIVIKYHGWILPYASVGQQRIGLSWSSALVAGLAFFHAARDPRVRAVALATLLGAVAAMTVKAAAQVLFENPRTIADFRRDRAMIFQAQGWSPDSPMARSYERRLTQNVATTWLGLSNVYATFAAAAAAALLAGTLASLRAHAERWQTAVLAFATGLATLGALLTQSKGAVLALALGFGLVALAWWMRRRQRPAPPRWAALLGPTLVVAALGLIVARGVIGERLGELSLLFRWFYMQAATRIALDHPLIGVGPDGFKDAYLLAKNPLSPEDVASPHIILFDWWACLGLAGVALALLLLLASARAAWTLLGPSASDADPPDEGTNSADDMPAPVSAEARTLVRAVAAIAAASTIAALWFEQAGLTPDAAVVRLLGLVMWILVAAAIALFMTRDRAGWPGAATAAAALVAAVHAQIDVTGSWPQSAGLFTVLVALAAAPMHAQTTARWRRVAATALGVIMALAALNVVTRITPPVIRWERALGDAAAMVRPLAELRWLQSASPSPTSREQAARLLSAELGQPVAATQIEAAADRLRRARTADAAQALATADAGLPPDFPTRREASRLFLTLAIEAWAAGDKAGAEAHRARAFELAASPPNRPPRALEANWRATLLEAWSTAIADQNTRAQALTELDQALQRSPYSLATAYRLLALAAGLQDQDRVAKTVPLVLELDDQARLDRDAVGLTQRQRRWVESLVKVPSGTPLPSAPPP